MNRNWGDSSDDESLDDHDFLVDGDEQQLVGSFDEKASMRAQDPPTTADHGGGAPKRNNNNEHKKGNNNDSQNNREERPPLVYDFPAEAPYTAYVGNLPYELSDVEHLKEAITQLAKERLGKEVTVVGGTIPIDKRSREGKGYGYIDLETVDQLKIVMGFNDVETIIAGRRIRVNTSNRRGGNNHNRKNIYQNKNSYDFQFRTKNKNDGPVDGNMFRGGGFRGKGGGGGQAGRQDKPSDDGPPVQRTSLKLAPRSKPLQDDAGTTTEGGRTGGSSSGSSSIFGGAKARDAQTWEKKRMEDKPARTSKEQQPGGSSSGGRTQSQGRGTGRGGRGGTGGRGGAGRGRGGPAPGRKGPPGNKKTTNQNGGAKANHDDKNKRDPQRKTGPPREVVEEPPKKAAVSNHFAALLMDSDSE